MGISNHRNNEENNSWKEFYLPSEHTSERKTGLPTFI